MNKNAERREHERFIKVKKKEKKRATPKDFLVKTQRKKLIQLTCNTKRMLYGK